MVGKDAKAREGEKAMVTRIRRAGVAAALALVLMATLLAGVAYAKIISGTSGNDYLLGTIKTDLIRGRGKTITLGLSQGTIYFLVVLVMT
jgi:hypothetical protein